MFNVGDTGCHTGVNRLVRHWGCLPSSSVTLFTQNASQKYVYLENRLHGGGGCTLLIMIQLVCGEQAEQNGGRRREQDPINQQIEAEACR